MKHLLSLVLLVLAGQLTKAQHNYEANNGAFEFSYANDFTSMNDKYYTNGVRFSLTLPIFNSSPFNPRWLRKSGASSAYHTLNFQYDVFTPDLKAELFTDRPFASTMMLGSKHQYVYDQKSLRITSELKLGLIGQATGAGKLQNGLHQIMPGADNIEGWETQIRNDMAINYIFGVEKSFMPSNHLEIIAGSDLYLGLPYTKLETGIMLRLGFFENYFNYLNNNTRRNWQAYLFTGAKASVVAYNATLQGGLLNPYNPYVLDEIEHFVGNYSVGLGLSYGGTNLLFSQTFITPEFHGGDSHSWGELRLIFCF